MIESGLRAAGRRTGLFTSPHLVEPTERIRIDGRPVRREQFAGRVRTACTRPPRRCLRAGALDMHPTYFETVTAMAFLLFREARRGLRWCSKWGWAAGSTPPTWCSPRSCVITPVDFDHEALLGKSLEAIAGGEGGHSEAGRAGGVRAPAPGGGAPCSSAAPRSSASR